MADLAIRTSGATKAAVKTIYSVTVFNANFSAQSRG